ncbi:MAG: UDP-N-acetylmuramoyl-L-alanyl-D-glutamate--2,6-diaminopimelate ligase [Acidimicrobiales bacterium]|nr:UDP-N-acetylmuramoyl-L-alanyl-D-glutamate--2,6-diaminopimelate ligase [Acidimicrobiales bacterium]
MAASHEVPLADLIAALGPGARRHAPAGAGAGAGASPEPDVPGPMVRGVTYDSRQVRPGWLFCCVPGANADGHRFAAEAADRGAVALLVEHRLNVALPQVEVADARRAMARIAAEFWGHPSRRLDLVGVTGTNGKTTVTQLLGAVFRAAGRRAEVIGTLSAARTTPEAADLQAQLAGFVEDGVDAVAMEVSSHALELHRVDDVHFRVALFTNLTRDHLDFHPTMEAYFQAKARLFVPELTERAVVNLDDPRGRLLRDAALVPTVGYALDDATEVVLRADGTSFVWRDQPMTVHLAGRHNLSNALAAATAASELGIPAAVIARGLASLERVPGRFEPVDAGQPFSVVVDYAHTPDALERILDSAREMVADGAKVLVVFGCGGDRDVTKRAPMGELASRLADVTVLTSDNPRGEPPLNIVEQVRSGAVPGSEVIVELDRRAAIAVAFDRARPGDVVVIAGKGHETTQTFADRTIAFDDRQVARELLAARGAGA